MLSCPYRISGKVFSAFLPWFPFKTSSGMLRGPLLLAVIHLSFFAALSDGGAQSFKGAVVTANPAATSAAGKILSLGGSAADAAIAAQLVLGVVEPQSSGIGGGAVLLYRESFAGPIRAFDGLSKSPEAYDVKASSISGFPIVELQLESQAHFD